MGINKYVSLSIAAIFAISSVGCGAGFRGHTKSTTTEQAVVNVDDSIAKAQAASDEAQKAMIEADAALASIMNDKGEIKLSLFSSSSVDSQTRTVGLLSPIVDKLNGVFDKLFAKVDVVKAQFNKARLLLADAIAKVEAAGGSAAQVEMLRTQLAKVDGLEAKFSQSMHLLAGKLDLATLALDKLVSSATSLIPGLGSIAGYFIDLYLMSDVKNLIASVKAKLLTL